MAKKIEKTARKVYTGLTAEDGFIVGLVTEGNAGYKPCPDLGKFPNYREAQAEADRLNAEIGVHKKDAVMLTLGSIGMGRP
jgi:uracil-DNA glycosylase